MRKKRIAFTLAIILITLVFVLSLSYLFLEKLAQNSIQMAKEYAAYHAGKIDEWIEIEGYQSEKITEYILSLRIYQNSYVFLTDNNGFIIAHPNSACMPSQAGDTSVNVREVYGNKQDRRYLNGKFFIATDYDHISRIFVPHSIESTGWNLWFAVPMDLASKICHEFLYWVFPVVSVVTILLSISVLRGLDRNRLKKSREDLRQTQKLYIKAISNMNTVLIDYDVQSKQAVYSEKFVERHGIPGSVRDTPQGLLEMKLVHREDIPCLRAMFDKIDGGFAKAECVVRIYDLAGNMIWYNMVMTNSFNKFGAPERAVVVVRDITEEKNAALSWKIMAERDPMTGFYNKAAGISRITEILASGGETAAHALFVLDIDNFKNINDTFGHAVGDTVIVDASRILPGIFRETDVVCRFGGDEFIVFAANVANTGLIEKKAEKICDSLRKSYGVGKNVIPISASVGVALFPSHGRTYEELFRNADAALYETKARGKDSYLVYSGQEILLR